jgi:hypothetical protein
MATASHRRSRRARSSAVATREAIAASRAWWANDWVICLGLLVVIVALYGRVIAYPFIDYDDYGYVVQNPHVRDGLSWQTFVWSLTATTEANWHPLTWLSHALDCQLFGLNAGGHHLTSVMIHAINAVLLFLLLRRTTGERSLSFLVAVLFAVHPFNVESVAWVAERKNVLSTMFLLLTLATYGWYARSPNWSRYLAVAAIFVYGLASKPMLVTLPALLVLLDYWPLQRIERWIPASRSFPVPQVPAARLLRKNCRCFCSPLRALS